MSDLQIGAHCAVQSCNVLDFLPIRCQCNKSFCSLHIPAESHGCTTLGVDQELSTFTDKIQRCALDECNKPSLRIYNGSAEETCSACHKCYCVVHRYPDSHQCPSQADNSTVTPTSSKIGSSAIQYTLPIFPKRKPPSDPVKFAQWQKVELLKMRHRALPGDPKDKTAALLPEQKLHVKILQADVEKVFWFRKAMTTGKALDQLAVQMGVVYPENTPLQLCPVSPTGETEAALRNDRPLADQVQDGSTLTIIPRKVE